MHHIAPAMPDTMGKRTVRTILFIYLGFTAQMLKVCRTPGPTAGVLQPTKDVKFGQYV